MRKKIVFRRDSDYFPARLHSRTSFQQDSKGSTQGMSYFNSQFMNNSTDFTSSPSYLSLPPIPPSTLPSTTEMDINKASNEAICGSHSKMCFVNAAADPTEDGSMVSSSPDEGIIVSKGTMRFMNIDLLHRINPTYSNDRLAQLYLNKTGQEHETKARYAREAPKRKIDKIVTKATSIYNEQNAQKFLKKIQLKGHEEQERARLPSVIRVPPTPNEEKLLAPNKPDPNRPTDAVYTTLAHANRVPKKNYNRNISACKEERKYEHKPFLPEDQEDFRPHILRVLQEFVIVKETVTRPAGRGTITSLTITKPRKYKYVSDIFLFSITL